MLETSSVLYLDTETCQVDGFYHLLGFCAVPPWRKDPCPSAFIPALFRGSKVSQHTAAVGMVPDILSVRLLSSRGVSPTLLPQTGALGADMQTLKLSITLASAAALTFGEVSVRSFLLGKLYNPTCCSELGFWDLLSQGHAQGTSTTSLSSPFCCQNRCKSKLSCSHLVPAPIVLPAPHPDSLWLTCQDATCCPTTSLPLIRADAQCQANPD